MKYNVFLFLNIKVWTHGSAGSFEKIMNKFNCETWSRPYLSEKINKVLKKKRSYN
jgi:hypothetical protein